MKIKFIITFFLICDIIEAMKFLKPSRVFFSFRQAFNLPGIKGLFRVIRNPSLCVPSIELKSINELNLSSLKNSGIRAVVFDKDNTLR